MLLATRQITTTVMTKASLFKRINNAVLDLQASEVQTYEQRFRTLGRLLRDEQLEEANAELTRDLNLDEFLADSSNRSRGIGGSKLRWPEDPDQELGMQLLVLQWLGENPHKAATFGHEFFHSGSKIIAGIHSMTRQFIIPFVRDYSQYVLDRAGEAGSTEVDNIPAVHVSSEVFIVHGHETGARESLARFLMTLGLIPIILHEQASKGRTVIEKVEAHGDVGFAVVLLTPDDEGKVRGASVLEPRARQNVLLELGYFLGRLGRPRVCALKMGAVEIPSDFAGVVWQEMDPSGGWKLGLARELKAAGYSIDMNRAT